MDPLPSPTPVTFYAAWWCRSCGTRYSYGPIRSAAASSLLPKAEMSLLERAGLLSQLDSLSPASSRSVYQKPVSGCVRLGRFSLPAVQL